MTRTRYRFVGNDAPYFMTMTVVNWLPVFTRPETVEILFESWRYLQQRQQLRIHGYVILENHLHLIARSETLDSDVQRFKSFTARRHRSAAGGQCDHAAADAEAVQGRA